MKSEKGQSLVETALILPILLLLLFGIVDFGRIFHAYLTLDHAGREAARAASITIPLEDSEYQDCMTTGKSKKDCQIIKIIKDNSPALDESKLTIDITPAIPAGDENRAPGTDVTIALTYNIDFITPLVHTLASPLTLNDTTIMRVE